MEDRTCGTCRHWHRLPKDPMNLGAPESGQCRAVPPSAQLFVDQAGQPLAIVANYPGMPGDFPACGLHQGRLELNGRLEGD